MPERFSIVAAFAVLVGLAGWNADGWSGEPGTGGTSLRIYAETQGL